MKDQYKTKKQLINELAQLHKRIMELEKSEAEHLSDAMPAGGRVEKVLSESEEHYRSLVEMTRDVLYTLSSDGTITFLSSAFEAITGWSHTDWIGKPFTGLIHPDDLPLVIKEFQRNLNAEIIPLTEWRILCKSGEYKIGEFMAAPQIRNGRAVRVVGIARDITERKSAEEALKEKTSLNQILLDNFHCTALLLRPYTREIVASNKAAVDVGAVPGKQCFATWGRRDNPCPWCLAPAVWATGEAKHLEVEALGIIWDAYWIPVAPDLYVHYAFDITERKRLEEETVQLAALVESSNDAIIGKTLDGIVTSWNKAAEKIYGYTESEIIGKPVSMLVSPEHEDEVPQILEKIRLEEHIKHYETVHRTKGGQHIHMSLTISPIKDAEGRIVAASIIGRDITERKRAEQQIQHLASFPQFNPDPVVEVAFSGAVTFCNPAAIEILREMGIEDARVFLPQDVDEILKILGPNQPGPFHRVVTVKDRLFEESICFAFGFDTVRIYSRDITERKRAEKVVLESEEKFRMVADFTYDWEYWLKPDGNFVYVSPSCERITGYRVDEFFDNPNLLTSIVHPDDYGLVSQHISEVLKPGCGICSHDFRIITRGGEERWISHYCQPVYSQDGIWLGRRGSNRDITERKRAEKERDQLFEQVHASHERLRNLSRRLVEVQEVERRELVRKLHDEVGQNLTALGINLNIVHSQLPPETVTKTATRIDDSLKLVEETVERIRDVMAELRPPVLDDYGVSAALHWYGKQFSERTGIITLLQVEELKPRLPLPAETALFRIAQEALTNVAKHAQAKNVTVRLEEFGESVHLSIADDGIGFDSEAHQQPEAKPEWGLINMRERSQAIGGQLSVETAPGKGTQIIVEVPRKH